MNDGMKEICATLVWKIEIYFYSFIIQRKSFTVDDIILAGECYHNNNFNNQQRSIKSEFGELRRVGSNGYYHNPTSEQV